MRPLLAALALILTPALHAQDTVIVIDPDAPPADTLLRDGPAAAIVDELVARFNDSAATRIHGDLTIPAGSRFDGRLAVHRGTLRIAGVVRGPIVVANGTLYLLPGAEIDGDILVVGGRLVQAETARHRGTTRVVLDAAPVTRAIDGTLVIRDRVRSLADLTTARTSFRTGRVRTTLSLGTAGTYNRIEGLPVFFGPRFDYHPSAATALGIDLRGLLRTASDGAGLRSDFGYHLQAAFRSRGRPAFGVEAHVYSVVEPIEVQALSAAEIGWAAVLLQRDYRDYFERQGLGGTLYLEPAPPVRLAFALRRDNEGSVRATDPWSLFRNTDRWRRNPLIDDGHYVTAELTASLDTRNPRTAPSSGWYLRLAYEHSMSDDVAPVTLPAAVRPPVPADGSYAFDRLTVDARRFLRVTPGLRLNARVLADGWLGGDRLPVQRRVSLGGPGLLPGYRFRAFACNQPDAVDPALPALCDRMIVTQLEARSRLRFHVGHRLPPREPGGTGRFLGIEEADLVFFADAGSAWLAGEGPGQVPAHTVPVPGEWKYDVGVGIDAGEIGAYLAKGFSRGEPVHFIVRLQRRF